jgi:hypothetical protein
VRKDILIIVLLTQTFAVMYLENKKRAATTKQQHKDLHTYLHFWFPEEVQGPWPDQGDQTQSLRHNSRIDS